MKRVRRAIKHLFPEKPGAVVTQPPDQPHDQLCCTHKMRQMLVLAFDMIASVSLRARLNARGVFDARGMKLQMWGIWLPALVSISANLAGAIQSFNANDFNHLFIFAWLLPLIGAVFPSMIVVLSLAADHLIDTTAINTKIDVEEFKK